MGEEDSRHLPIMMLSQWISTSTTIHAEWRPILLPIAEKHDETFTTKWTAEMNKMEGTDIQVFPETPNIFRAFSFFKPSDLKAVIIGQDAYHSVDRKTNKPHAQGLCFSVPNGSTCPPSLLNILKNLHRDKGRLDLTDWAEQGVLLINVGLTVREGAAGSHLAMWRPFVHDVCAYVGELCRDIAVLLWGKFAQEFAPLFKHAWVHMSAHPSPLSRQPFNGGFEEANAYLRGKGKEVVRWV